MFLHIIDLSVSVRRKNSVQVSVLWIHVSPGLEQRNQVAGVLVVVDSEVLELLLGTFAQHHGIVVHVVPELHNRIQLPPDKEKLR